MIDRPSGPSEPSIKNEISSITFFFVVEKQKKKKKPEKEKKTGRSEKVCRANTRPFIVPSFDPRYFDDVLRTGKSNSVILDCHFGLEIK